MDTSREKFLLEVNEFVEDFFVEFGYEKDLVDVTKKMIDYMVPHHSKTITPFCILEISKIIKPNLSAEEQQMADALGWIYQMFEAFICVHDDYLDQGDRRLGKTSWSKLHNHSKTVVVHDASLLKAIAFYTLQRKFSSSPSMYLKLLEIFCYNDNLFLKGSFMDNHYLIKNLQNGKKDSKLFNMETYNIIARWKATGFMFLPMALAMTITGFHIEKSSDLYKNIISLFSDFGILTMAFDDYFDCYSPSTGVVSSDSDIKRGQLTWLFVTAKEKCKNNNEVQELVKKYGRDNDESVKFIKTQFEKIGIHDIFKIYCDENYNKAMKKIDEYFKEAEVVHKIMTWYIPFFMKFMRDGAGGLLE